MQAVVIEQLVGQRIEKYQITRSLGHGTLSAVYEAHKEGADFILTTILVPETLSAQARERFLTRFAQESGIITRLQHPYILPIQDVGEYAGNPFFVTPFIKGSTLTKLLKRKGRFTPEQAAELLKRLADGFDFAHSNGVLHGTVSSANILLGGAMQIVGFGLLRLLAMQGIEEGTQTATRSIAGTPLGTSGYIAPEVLRGEPFDRRIDVYALGILMLELLSGSFPFPAATDFTQPPRLSLLCPNLSISLDEAIQQALVADPAQRVSSAGEFAALFEQAVRTASIAQAAQTVPGVTQNMVHDAQVTLPSSVDWAIEEDILSTGRWQATTPAPARSGTKKVTGPGAKPSLELPTPNRANTQRAGSHDTTDPFAWWANMSASQVAAQQTPDASVKASTAKKRPQKQDRRRVVALLAGGGVVALGALGFGGVALAHVLQGRQAMTAVMPPVGKAPTAPQHPVKQIQPMKTGQPMPPPQHKGTIIGKTNLGVNMSQTFTNPQGGTASILVHLQNGNFAAYNSACTHQGVTVYYDNATHRLMCPAHGAVFNATNGAAIQGPTTVALASVAIRINGDGTITAG